MPKKPEVTVSYTHFAHRPLGVIHTYAQLFYRLGECEVSEELWYNLTASGAERMNKEDGHVSYSEGDQTRRFLSVEHVKRRARERAAEIFPDGFTLKTREHYV